MKSFFITLFAFLTCFSLSAQNQITLNNRSSMNIEFNMMVYTTGACASTGNQVYIVPPYSSLIITAPGGEEYVFAEIAPSPLCTPSFSVSVGTPQNCVSTCSVGVPSFFAGPNMGCAGGFPTVNIKWDDCAPGGTGIITVVDF